MNARSIPTKVGSALRRGAIALGSMALVAGGWLWRTARRLATSPAVRRSLVPLRRISKLAAVSAFLFAGTLAFGTLMLERIPAGMIGVRQVDWGSSRGIETKDYGPGFHWSPPFRDQWHRIDGRTNVLHFGPNKEGGAHPLLEVRTREGNTAQVAVVVPYRVRPGEAHQLVSKGLKDAYRARVKATAEKLLLQELASLTSDEFSDTALRLERSTGYLPELNRRLADHHVVAEGIYISGVFFPPAYEVKKQEKQLEGQKIHTDRALAEHEAQKTTQAIRRERIEREELELANSLDYELARIRYREGTTALEERRQRIETIQQSLAIVEANRKAEWDRRIQDESRVVGEKSLFDQRIANKTLLAQNDAALEARRAELIQLRDRASAEEGQGPLDEATLRNEILAESLEAEVRELRNEGLRAIEQERLAFETTLAQRKRDTNLAVDRSASEVDVQLTRLDAEGDLALARAQALESQLEGEALAAPGGRHHLAREAARNLKLTEVELDSRDPRVPNLFDIDGLMALLIGEGD